LFEHDPVGKPVSTFPDHAPMTGIDDLPPLRDVIREHSCSTSI
jgi:hypothetical protein